MWNALQFCPILTTFGVSWQIFIKIPSIIRHGNQYIGSHGDTCGQTDWHDKVNRHCLVKEIHSPQLLISASHLSNIVLYHNCMPDIKLTGTFCNHVNVPRRHKNVLLGTASLAAASVASLPVITTWSDIQDKCTYNKLFKKWMTHHAQLQ
jgi:hypothetical protein